MRAALVAGDGMNFIDDYGAARRQHVAAGAGEREIIDWMVARYGNFIRLRPPLKATTALLWGVPGLALGAGLAAVLLRRRRAPPAPLSDAELARLQTLLKP